MIRHFLATMLICSSTLCLTAAEPTEQIAQLCAAAEAGNASAQYELALRYDNGTGVEKNAAEAVKWYTKAAEQGHADAQCNLGVCYEYGEGVPSDIVRAVQLYTAAAEQGLANAQCNLGLCYEEGTGVKKDYEQALKLYTAAAEQDFPDALFHLGRCYYMGLGVARDYNKAAYWTKKAADAGLAEAKTMMSIFYLMGTEETPRNSDKANELLNEAKKGGEKEVSGLISLFLNNKDDAETDAAKEKLFTAMLKAAEQYGGEVKVLVDLAMSVMNMQGISGTGSYLPSNLQGTLEEGAKSNDPHAQLAYALYLLDRDGKDSEEGMKYLRASAANNDLAQIALMFLNKSKGLQEDAETLQKMKEKAYGGDVICQFMLGGWYYSLPQGHKDRDQCITWWEKAKEHNFPPASYQLGLYYYELGHYKESIEYLLQASELAFPNDQNIIFDILHQLNVNKNIQIDKEKMEELRQRLQKHGRDFDNEYSGFFTQLKEIVSTLYKVAMYIMNNISGLS